MPVISASIRQYGEKPTDIPENFVDARYCLSIEGSPTNIIYIPSHDDVIPMLPPGASYTKARLADMPMPNINRNAGFITGKSAISSPVYNVVDVDNELTDLLADWNANGIGSHNATIKQWEFSPATLAFYDRIPRFTGLVQNHDKPYNTVRIETADINRGLDVEIFDPVRWKLNSGIDAAQTTIPTTLPITQIATNNKRLWRTIGDLAKPGEEGSYLLIEKEIIWFSDLVDVGGVATFTGCERGMLGSTAAQHDVAVGTKEEDKPDIMEWIVIDEPALELIKGLISGTLYGNRQMPSGWSAAQGSEWIEPVSFAAHATPFRLQFQNPGKVKCRDFIDKQILALMNAVLVVDGRGQLNYTPRVMPVDDESGEITLNPSNCVMTNEMLLRHVKSDIYPSVKINFDWNPTEKLFMSSVTYRDEESASHNKLDVAKTKEFNFKGLHAGIHTSKQLTKLAATYGDDYFYEHVEFNVESFVNDIELGSLVNCSFPAVRDDSGKSGFDEPLNRTMLVIAANENRAGGTRTTTYSMVGSLYKQSERQAGEAQHHAEIEEYKRGKTDITTLSGLSVVNGIATGSCTLQMGERYYYVNDASPGEGLEFSASLVVTISGLGPQPELYVFGPFINKTTIDLTGKSNHIGGLGGTAAYSNTRGNRGYCLSTVSSSPMATEQAYGNYLSSDETIYTKIGIRGAGGQQGTPTKGYFPIAPDPRITLNDGIIGGIPSNLGGTGGSGGAVQKFTDADKRPRSLQDQSAPNPTTSYLNGSSGGRGGGGLTIVSWGGGNSGNGKIIVSGSNAGSVTSATYSTNFTMQGTRGCGGGPGSILWIVDGNWSAPFLDNTNVEAYYGDGSMTGTRIRAGELVTTAGSPTNYRGLYDAQSHLINHADKVTRIAYLPAPEKVIARQLTETAEFFANQRDGKVKLIVQNIAPTNANLGDAWITQSQLDGGLPQPVFSVLTETGWRVFDWNADEYAGTYGGLISMYRSYGTNVWLTSDERPIAFEDGWAWTNGLTGETWILYNNQSDVLVQVGDSPVGMNHYRDGNFSLQQEAIARGVAGPWNIGDTLDVPELVAGKIVTPTPGDGTAPAPQSLTALVYSGTLVEVIVGRPADETLVESYNIYRDDALLTNVVKPAYSYLDSSVTALTVYTYEVTTVDAQGDESAKVGTNPPTVQTPSATGPAPVISGVSVSGGFIIGTTGGPTNTLPAPTNLTVSIYSETSGELFWTAPGSPGVGTGYEVRRDGLLETTLSGAATANYYFENMTAATPYLWEIRLVGGGEVSDWVSVQGTSDDPVGGPTYDLDPVTGAYVNIAGSTAAELFWTPPVNLAPGDSYNIYQDDVLISEHRFGTSLWMDTGLSSGITYQWKIRTVNSTGPERSEDVLVVGTMN